jgi:hypothetical protein
VMTTYWRTIGFTAAAPGWRLLYFNKEDPSKPCVYDLPGWTLQERCEEDDDGVLGKEDGLPETRLVACDVSGFWCEPVDDVSNFWQVIGPSEAMPSEEECIKAFRNYEQRQKAYAETVRLEAEKRKAAAK